MKAFLALVLSLAVTCYKSLSSLFIVEWEEVITDVVSSQA